MARYAMIQCSIWEDSDFQALSEGAQRLYLLLLSQRRRSMVGVLPYTLRSWARGCTTTDVEHIAGVLAELEAAGFVVVDLDTDELLIRTVIKHDPPRGPKSIVAMWRAIDAIESPRLRDLVLQYVTADAWESHAVPEWAIEDKPDGASDGGCSLEALIDHPSSFLLPPSNLPPSSPCDVLDWLDTSERETQVIDEMVTQRIRESGTHPRNPSAYRKQVRSDIEAQYGGMVRRWCAERPESDVSTLARRLLMEAVA
jgi:hypothetical protein